MSRESKTMVAHQPLLWLAVIFLIIGIALAIAVSFGAGFPYDDWVIKALIIIGIIFLIVWAILVIWGHIKAS